MRCVNHAHDLWIALCHDDVIKWKHFPRYWPFVRGIHRSPVISPHKGQWRGQGSHKNLRKKFHDFSMTFPCQNPNFQTENTNTNYVNICFYGWYGINHRYMYGYTLICMIQSKPTKYLNDFTGDWTESCQWMNLPMWKLQSANKNTKKMSETCRIRSSLMAPLLHDLNRQWYLLPIFTHSHEGVWKPCQKIVFL